MFSFLSSSMAMECFKQNLNGDGSSSMGGFTKIKKVNGCLKRYLYHPILVIQLDSIVAFSSPS